MLHVTSSAHRIKVYSANTSYPATKARLARLAAGGEPFLPITRPVESIVTETAEEYGEFTPYTFSFQSWVRATEADGLTSFLFRMQLRPWLSRVLASLGARCRGVVEGNRIEKHVFLSV